MTCSFSGGEIHGLRREVLALAVASCFVSIYSGPALSSPIGPQVVAGSASFSQFGKTLNITNSNGAVINWQGFSIGADEVTRFLQSGANSAVLNRVIGSSASNILGQLLSNGKVFLINPNGVFIGGGAVIDVGGFTASTLQMSDSDFLAGRFRFTDQVGAARIVNQGTIQTPAGGQVYLVAPNVENHGVITSPNGEVILAAGKTVELVNTATLNVRVELTAPENEALNVGQVVVGAGRAGIYGTTIRNSGLVSANSAAVDPTTGKIVFRAKKDITLESTSRIEANGPKGGQVGIQAEGGTLLADGVVEAKGAIASGGTIHLLGDKVGLVGNASVDASGQSGGGTILVGGDFQGKNTEIQNAKRSFVGADSVIRANADGSGNGGKVIVWADEATGFYGTLEAKGGAVQGNGGFAEVSGKGFLDFRGHVDLSAARGVQGALLLDPLNIEIGAVADVNGDGSAGDDLNAAVNTPNILVGDYSGQTSKITAGQLVIELNSTDVSLAATNNISVLAQVDASGNVNSHSLTLDAGNLVDIQQAIKTKNGLISVKSGAGGISIGGALNAGTASVVLESTGIVSQTAAITAGTLDLRGAAGTFTLNTSDNAVTNLKADTDTLTTLNLRSATGYSILGISASGNAELEALSGLVTQTGAIVATGLELGGTAGYTLTSSNNDVATIALTNGAGVIRYVDANTLNVGTVNSVGIARSNDVALNARTGDIVLAQGVNLGSVGNLRLEATAGNISQTAGVITAGSIGANAQGISLGSANLLAVGGTFAGKSLTEDVIFNNANGFNIGSVAADGVIFSAVNGVSTVAPGKNIVFDVGAGTVTQSSGAAIRTDTLNGGATGGLALKGAAAFLLQESTNNVATIAASTGAGAVSIVDANVLTVGIVNPTGIVRTNDVLLNVLAGDLTVSQSIDVGALSTLRLQANTGNVIQTAGTLTAGALGVNAGGSITLGGVNTLKSGGTFSAKASGGDVLFKNANGFDIGTVAANGTVFTQADGITAVAAGKNVTLDVASGTVTQTTGKTVRTDTANAGATGGLELKGAASYSLTDVGNNVSTIAANTTGAISYTDAGGFAVGSVNTVGISSAGVTLTSLGGGAISVNNPINSTAGGVATFVNGGALAFNADVVSDGGFQQTGAGTVTFNSGRSITTTADPVHFSKAVTLASGDLSISTAGGAVAFDSTLAGGGNLVLLNAGSAGDVTLSGAASGISNLTISNANAINLASVGASGSVDLAGQGLATLSGAVSAGGPVTLRVNDLALANTINAGTQAVKILPATPTRSILVGALGGGTLQLSSAELSSISTSGLLTIGDAAQTGSIVIGGAIASPAGASGGLLFWNGTGGIAVNAPLTYTSGAGNLTLRADGAGGSSGAISDNGSGVVRAPVLNLRAGSGIGTMANPLWMQGSGGTTLTVQNQQAIAASTSGDVSIAYTGAGSIALAGVTQATTGGQTRIQTQDGSINTGSSAVNSAGSVELTANANGTSVGNSTTLTVGSGGITSNGKVILRAADDVTVNGAIDSSTGNGDIVIVAGNASGMNPSNNTGVQKAVGPASLPGGTCVAGGTTSGCVYAATETNSDASGAVTINAPVTAGAGDIVIESTGAVSQPSTGNTGLRNSGSGSLVVRTFNSTPASSVVNGAVISLANGTASGNLNGSGGVTLETRFANDNDYSVAHPGDYGPSSIDYQSSGGLVIRGVGTGADYVGIASTQNIDLNALNIQAKNLTLIANNGDVLVNTQIKNSNINNGRVGGSLKLYASNDIKLNWVAGTNDVTIGEATAMNLQGTRTTIPFAHDLKLTAANNIDIHGAIYLNGDLTLRADASLVEATTVGGAMSLGNGRGGVNIQYSTNATQPLEVSAGNILVGGRSGGTLLPVEFLNIDASTGTTASAVGNMTVRKDVQLLASNAVEVFLGGSGPLGSTKMRVIGGNASAVSSTGQVARATAFAGIDANSISITELGGFGINPASILVQAGTSQGSNTAGGGALALADAVLLARTSKSISIGGHLIIMGGNTSAFGSAVVSAGAVLDPLAMNISVGGNLVLQAGIGVSTAARMVNQGNILLDIGGGANYTFTNSSGGNQVVGPGLILIGESLNSGLFNGQKVRIDGNALPIQVTFTGGGQVRLVQDSGRSEAFVQSGVIPNLDSLLNYLIFAANEETKAARIRAGLGAGDDSNLPACN